jgi:hypothetical protein
MARPLTLTHKIMLRVTDDEYARLTRLAKELGIGLAPTIRTLINPPPNPFQSLLSEYIANQEEVQDEG